MAEILTKLKGTFGFGRDILILSFGIVVAQLIPLLLQPYLKRVFSAEDFGIYDVYLKSFSILVAISTLRYENAILLPKKESDSKHIVFLCIVLSLLFFVIMILSAFFFGSEIIELLGGGERIMLYILPFSVIGFSVFNVFNLYLIRHRKFLLSSTSKISRRASEGVVQVFFGVLKYPSGLLIGDGIGNIVQGIYSYLKVKRYTSLKCISIARIKKVAVEYRELPIYTLLPNVLNTFVLGSLTFLVLDKFDINEVGYIEFSQRILSIPSVFISIAISQVVFQRVTKLINDNKKILPLILSVIVILLLISILFVLIIQFYGNEIYKIIGGPGWGKSGHYAKILVFASASMLLFSPIGKVLLALKKFKINSFWEIAKFMAIFSLFFMENRTVSEYLYLYTGILFIFYSIYGVLIIYYSYRYQIENKTSS